MRSSSKSWWVNSGGQDGAVSASAELCAAHARGRGSDERDARFEANTQAARTEDDLDDLVRADPIVFLIVGCAMALAWRRFSLVVLMAEEAHLARGHGDKDLGSSAVKLL